MNKKRIFVEKSTYILVYSGALAEIDRATTNSVQKLSKTSYTTQTKDCFQRQTEQLPSSVALLLMGTCMIIV